MDVGASASVIFPLHHKIQKMVSNRKNGYHPPGAPTCPCKHKAGKPRAAGSKNSAE